MAEIYCKDTDGKYYIAPGEPCLPVVSVPTKTYNSFNNLSIRMTQTYTDKIRKGTPTLYSTPYITSISPKSIDVTYRKKYITINGTQIPILYQGQHSGRFTGVICGAGGYAGNTTNYLGGGKRTAGGGGGGGGIVVHIATSEYFSASERNEISRDFTVTFGSGEVFTFVGYSGSRGTDGAVACSQGDKAGGNGGRAEVLDGDGNVLATASANGGQAVFTYITETITIVAFLQGGGKGGAGWNDGNGAQAAAYTVKYSPAMCNILGIDNYSFDCWRGGAGLGGGGGACINEAGRGGNRSSSGTGGSGGAGGPGGYFYIWY